MNYPLFYAMGGSEEVYKLSREVWEAITWQWTQYGQIHDEFDAYYDWMHHGESSIFFYFFGLADPYVLKDRQRAVKFAGFYTGENSQIPNYDKNTKQMRSPITGSRGPRFQMTEEDWVTHREILDNYLPPFEDIPGVDGNGGVCPWSDDDVYREILQRINERQARGDVPLNLCATSLMTHAFLYTADDSYKRWVLDYVKAWEERTTRNGGVTPDNIGLSGEIGEYNDGKWWGGYYGWRWPHGAMTILEPEVIGCSNAMLLTGDVSWLNLARSQLDMLWSLRKQDEKGRWVVPNRHYDDGWRDYRPPHPMYGVYLWNLSQKEEDAVRAERGCPVELFEQIDSNYQRYGQTIGYHMGFNGNTAQWFHYMRGRNPEYPVKLLHANLEVLGGQLEKMRSSKYDPLTRDHYDESMSIHQWQQLMPVIVEGLAQLTMGGPMHAYHGGLQHARLRYYDARKARPGLPEDIAALVESLGDEEVVLQLVNLSMLDDRDVIVQGGVFGEHAFTMVETLNSSGEATHCEPVQGKWVRIHLRVGTGIRLRLRMKRYVNRPSYDTPWEPMERHSLLKGRDI